MRRLLCVLMLIGFFVLPTLVEAACVGGSPTWTAADASQAEVALCIAAAVSGDTINVPAGSATWSVGHTINTKDLAIIGAGSGSDPGTNTVITTSVGNYCFYIALNGATSSASRISGFRFNECGVFLRGLNSTKAFRIDNNYFNQASTTSWTIYGGDSIATANAPQGLIDHNTFTHARFVVVGSLFIGTDDQLQRQHKIWSRDPGFGGAQAVYIEDNILEANTLGTVDCNNGGRFVYRFNTVNVTTIYAHEVHGVQGPNRACQRWEMYGNTITQLGTQTFTMSFIRGGSGFHFGNTMSVAGFGNGPSLKVERATDVLFVGLCDGSWIIDGNIDTGYPCRDQIGRSQDSTWYSGVGYPYSGSVAWPTQALTPVYTWNNLQNSVQLAAYRFNGTATHNAEERDFYNFSSASGTPQTVGVRVDTLANRPAGCTAGVGYWATDQGSWNTSSTNPRGVQQNGADGVLYKCTATDTWNVLYTPYTYPHPLQGAPSPPAPDALAGTFSMAAFSGNTFGIFIWPRSTDATHKQYNVYRCLTSAACTTLVYTVTPTLAAVRRTPETQFLDSSLYVSGTYYYSVSDVNTYDYVGPASTPVPISVTGKQ